MTSMLMKLFFGPRTMIVLPIVFSLLFQRSIAQDTVSVEIVLEFKGRVAQLNESQVDVLQQVFATAYNAKDIVTGSPSGSSGDLLTEVDIVWNPVADTLVDQAMGTTQPFKLLATVTCQGCTNGALFSAKAGRSFFSYDPASGPNTNVVTARFNAELENLPSPVVAIDGLMALQQVESVDCTADLTELETTILIMFQGDPTDVTQAEFDALSAGFMNAYNFENSITTNTRCDRFFTRITEVSVDPTQEITFGGGRRINQVIVANPGRSLQLEPDPLVFGYYFAVKYVCRDCLPGSPLLHPTTGVTRALNASPDKQVDSWQRLVQQVVGSDLECVCPFNAKESRLPTRDEVFVVFGNVVRVLQQQDRISSVEKVDEVVEVQSIECGPEVDTFETEVPFEFQGDPDSLTEQDREELGQLFVLTYNDLANNGCDDQFRSLVNATITFIGNETDARRRLRVPRPFQFMSFTALFRVTGVCRKCPNNAEIFSDDGGRRRLALSDSNSSTHLSLDRAEKKHSLQKVPSSNEFHLPGSAVESDPRRRDQGEGGCFCDVEAPPDREPPSSREFDSLFQDGIESGPFNASFGITFRCRMCPNGTNIFGP